jgi:1-deoxy-D-xylulose-5-phosphate reductoisomerase
MEPAHREPAPHAMPKSVHPQKSGPRRVVILGATGSIGQSAVKVARDLPDRMQIVGISGHRNMAGLSELSKEFPNAALAVPFGADTSLLPLGRTIFSGPDGLCELATMTEADMVLVAIVGTGGVRPALAAIAAGKDLAVASKEILVMAGEAVMDAARRKGVRILPVDSEHNAIFQCLEEKPRDEVRRLILTASGGPFRLMPTDQLQHVTREQALRHPTWIMGAKITIDSATLFNKGLEMIEARWLFDIEMRRVEMIVHPQSIVHSMVEFVDHSILAQLSATDMCFPIQYAVTWPDRLPNRLPPLDFAALRTLEFEAPRRDAFPAVDLATWAGETGGTLPAVMNAANEVAVEHFLRDLCGFTDIWKTVEAVMQSHTPEQRPDLDTILAADTWARQSALERLK